MRRVIVMSAIMFAVSCGLAMADTVSLSPDPPVAGQDLDITYDPTGRPLEGETTVYLRYGFNDWSPEIMPDALVTSNGAPYVVTVAVPSQATEINFAFHNGGDPQVWDGNDGQDWDIAVTGGDPNPNVGVNPDPVEAGEYVTVTYDASSGPLVGVSQVYMHYGFNTWNPTIEPDVAMNEVSPDTWEATVWVKSYAFELTMVFNDGAETWDNNDWFDWRLPVTGTTPVVTVVPDQPVAGQDVTVIYNPEDRPLADAATVYLRYGGNDWRPIYDDVLMTSNGELDVWEVTVPLSVRACLMDITFSDTGDPDNPATIWDNNGGSGIDWHYETVGCKPIVSELDGLYLAWYDAPSPTQNRLYVGVGGNLRQNGSAMVIFIDALDTTGGQTELRAGGAEGGVELMTLASRRIDMLSCGTVGTGTILPGEADYALYVNYADDGNVYFNEYFLSTDSYGIPDLTCCDGSELLVYATQVYAGYTLANDGNQAFEGDEGQGYTGGFDDSNTSGVPVDVLTGLEIGIPLAKIGYGMAENEGFNIFVAQMPNGCSAPRGQFSNQTLPAADEAAGFCDPPQMFPLRADMSSFTSVHSVAQVSDLPAFGGVADGVIVPADYSGAADELQTCPVADSVVDGTVSLVPDAIQGEDVTVWYVSTNGPLEGSAEVYLNYDFDDAATPYANRVLMVATNGLTGSEWIATVTMDTGALQFDVYFDDGVTTDDNTGQNWHFAVGRAATGPAVVIVPDPATAGLNVTVTYDPIGRVLEGADAVSIHYGFNSWSSGVTDAEMTRQTDCTWEVTFQVSDLAGGPQGLSMVFFEPGGAWDNNDGNNWHFEVTPQGEPPFNMDGELDSCAVLVAINGDGTRHLYAGLLDGWLYVATEAAQANNDHFIFLSTNGPVAQTPAPWGKSGTVGEHDGFLAQEVGNGWNGWQDGLDGLSGPASMDNDVLEGQINLATQFVNYPSTIFMAMGAWGNDNEDPLRPELQIPEGNGDLNIDADEYIEVTPSLDPDPADFDEDCDVDLVDYAAFQACLNGPNNPPAGGCAVDADFDDDGDVDLKDFAEFQVAFTG